MLAGRIESFFNRAGNHDRFAPDGIEAEFRRLYYDTANATHPASMAALTSLVPMSQITYGSDTHTIRSIRSKIYGIGCRLRM